MHIAEGHTWNEALDSTFKDVNKSCERGLGGSRQAAALSLDEMRDKAPITGAIVSQAPPVILVGAWWMLREMQLAALTAGQLTFETGPGCGIAVVEIAASKNETRAKGAKRRHGCACPSPLCLVNAARKLKASRQGAEDSDPLVVTTEGRGVTKDEMTHELRTFAAWLGDGEEFITGHSMRVTGAQRLALVGVSENQIRLFGRWASGAMLLYTREALLGKRSLTTAKQVEEHDGLQAKQQASSSRTRAQASTGAQNHEAEARAVG